MTLFDRIEAALGVRPVASEAVSGGCINDAQRVDLPGGASLFVKTHRGGDPALFPAEAAGLAALAAAGPDAPPTPEVLHVEPELLVLRWLKPGRLADHGWRGFGAALAALHHRTSPDGRHGFPGDNFIGATPQPNPWSAGSGAAAAVEFFAEHRIGFQVRLGRDRGLLTTTDVAASERLVARLPGLLAPCAAEPCALLHGDLWSGNVHAADDGTAWLIDPATYYGFREADLAMTRLFGGFPPVFYRAYDEAWPLPTGAAERVPLFNLYHLLNHLNLFGAAYLGQVRSVLANAG